MKDTLQIVGCSGKKIWDYDGDDATFYLPAGHVYKGRGFLKALAQITGPWVILSAKYGFIEPEHPICNYDIRLGSAHSISDASLRAQVRQQRDWAESDEERISVRLIDFQHIVCLNCDRHYIKKIRASFTRNQIHIKE